MVSRGEHAAPSVDTEGADHPRRGGRGLGKAAGLRARRAAGPGVRSQSAAVAATRAVVDAGWYPYAARSARRARPSRRSSTSRPGISGRDPAQGRHAGSENIVAINKDANAPIFEFSDLGIVGDLNKILPKLADGREGEEGLVAAVAPSQFPPPVNAAREFIGPPTDPEDERIEVGVAIVGGGQAGMACAIRLLQLLEHDPELAERLGEVPVAVIEKGRVAGAHQMSGAVMNPVSIKQLLPDRSDFPHFGEVPGDRVYFVLNKKRAVPLKPVPPPFRNHGNVVISVAELNRYLGEIAEEAGAYVLSETSGYKLLVEDGVVRGVRTGDKGRDKAGGEKSNFEPGNDIIAKATVLAEGNWGHLTGAALKGLGLAPQDPQVWALGVKEVWEVPSRCAT
jgi:hypothetical protein